MLGDVLSSLLLGVFRLPLSLPSLLFTKSLVDDRFRAQGSAQQY